MFQQKILVFYLFIINYHALTTCIIYLRTKKSLKFKLEIDYKNKITMIVN